MSTAVLESQALSLEIDAERGCDVLSIVHRESQTQLMFSTPWRRRADAVRAGSPRLAGVDSMTAWLEQYRGGWQTLTPNAGPTQESSGATLGYHGEASTARWDVVESSPSTLRAHVDLFMSPLSIDRVIRVAGSTVTILDSIRNRGRERLDIDFVSHPAFGGEIVAEGCRVETDARVFTRLSDEGEEVASAPVPRDLSAQFGWFEDFDNGRIALVNDRLGLAVRLSWDAELLPYAWYWQELSATTTFPWFGEARVIAIEPASTPPPGGSASRKTISLAPHGSREFEVSLEVDATAQSRPRPSHLKEKS